MKKKHQGLFLGGILILSSIAFAFLSATQFSPENQQEQTGPQLEYLGQWKGMALYGQRTGANTTIYYLQLYPNYRIMLRADPRASDSIEGPPSSEVYSRIYDSSTVYVVFDPNASREVGLAYTELARFLTNKPFELKFATTEPYTDEFNRSFPVKNPHNTTESETVIYLRLANQTDIEMEGNTIVVDGRDRWDLVNAAGRLELILIRLI